jgi:hypothetical protein
MSKAQKYEIDSSHRCSVVHVKDYYDEKGVIFEKDYRVGIEMQNLQTRYTPKIEDIKKAEKIFGNKYNGIVSANSNPKTSFYHWVRQYIGLIDSAGNRNIVMQLINNTKPRRVRRILGKGWETTFVIILSDDFYRISKRLRINIDTGEMTDQL